MSVQHTPLVERRRTEGAGEPANVLVLLLDVLLEFVLVEERTRAGGAREVAGFLVHSPAVSFDVAEVLAAHRAQLTGTPVNQSNVFVEAELAGKQFPIALGTGELRLLLLRGMDA